MNVIKVFAVLSGLSSVHRYSMMKLGNPESVLEHTGMVALLTILIAKEINHREEKELVRVAVAALKACVHDIEEIIVGDVPRPTKYFSKETREMFRTIERRGVRKVLSEMELSPELQEEAYVAHQSSKDGMEGYVVAIADALAVVYKVWEEVIVRNNMGLVRQSFTVAEQLARLSGTAKEFGLRTESVDFLLALLAEGFGLMISAQGKEHPIHGAIKEEMIG